MNDTQDIISLSRNEIEQILARSRGADYKATENVPIRPASLFEPQPLKEKISGNAPTSMPGRPDKESEPDKEIEQADEIKKPDETILAQEDKDHRATDNEPEPSANVDAEKNPSSQQLEEIKKAAFAEGQAQGHEQGYEKGYETGKIEGAKEAKDTLDQSFTQALASFENMVMTLTSLNETDHEDLSKSIEAVILQLTQKRLGQAIKESPTGFVDRIDLLLQRLGRVTQSPFIKLNPQDLEIIRPFIERHNILPDAIFSADPQLSHGDIRIAVGTIEIEDLLSFESDSP